MGPRFVLDGILSDALIAVGNECEAETAPKYIREMGVKIPRGVQVNNGASRSYYGKYG